MQKLAAWFAVVSTVLTILPVLIVMLLMHSTRFHTYLLRTAQQKATAALGSEVRLRDFAIGWHNGPGVDLYGVSVAGAPPHPSPLLFDAESIRARVTISSFLHQNWYVDDIQLAHPIVRITADRQGVTNFPRSSSSTSSQSSPNVFDLGVRHLTITRGEIYYNDAKSDIAADVHELAMHSAFDAGKVQYTGTLSYRNGTVQWPNANPVRHNLDARFTATPREFTLENTTLSTQDSRISINAQVRNYSQPDVHATYDALLDIGEFGRILKNPSLPTGTIQTSGTLAYNNPAGRSFLSAAEVTGNLLSERLRIPVDRRSASVQGLRARYTLAEGNVSIADIQAEILGGKVSGDLIMRNLEGATRSSGSMRVQNVSVAEAQSLLAPNTSPRAKLRGSFSANADASWGKNLSDLVARTKATLRATMQSTHDGSETPVRALLNAEYAARGETVSFHNSTVSTPQTLISLDGTVSRQSSLRVHAATQDLQEIERLAQQLQPTASTPLNLHGHATLNATVTGSTQNPRIQGQLAANDLQVRGTSWKALRTDFFASPESARLDSGQLLSATRGRIEFQLATSLHNWAATSSSALKVNVNASDLNVDELSKAAGINIPLAGRLSANIQGRGTPSAPIGQGTIRLADAHLSNEPVRSANVTFEGTGSAVVARLQVDLPAGAVTGNIKYQPRSQAYEASLKVSGLRLEKLDTISAKNLHMTGVLNATASGSGTLNDPAMRATLEIPRLQIQSQTVDGIKVDADVAQHIAKFAFASQMLTTRASGHGTVQLTGDYPADIVFDTDAIPLQPLIAMYSPAQAPDMHGETELHATLHGPLKNKTALEAHLVVPKLNIAYKNAVQLALAEPAHADYANGTLEIKKSVIRGTGTNLTFQAKVPSAKDAPASVLLRGGVDLRLAQLFSPDITSGGEVQFDIDSFGARSNLGVQGQIRIVNASFTQAGLPVGLRDGNGVLTLSRDRLDITQFHGTVGGGTVTARGGLVYRPALYFDLNMNAEGVRALYQQSIRATVNSNLALSGQYDNAYLRGQVNVEQLSFTSNFDLMDFTGSFGGADATSPPTGGPAENLHLQISVQTPGGLNLASRNLSVAGSANLQVRGTAAQPVMLGRINLSDGTLIFSGNRYLVQGGTIDFRNPSRTEPVVDLSARTTIQQYDIQMHFWGPTDHLHTNYSSDPALPPADVINLIAFGKTSEAVAANPSPSGTLGAQSLLASQASSQITSRVEKLAGISQLSVDPVLGSSQQNPGARIGVQQRVTSKIFVTFATDVTSTQQQSVKLEYQASRRTSMTIVRDQNGGVSFETSFRKRW